MSNNRPLPRGLLCALVFMGMAMMAMMATTATAAIIQSWEYEITTTWSGATYSPGAGSQTETPTQLSWGQADATEPWAGGTSRSGLELADVATQPGTVITDGATAPTLEITHFNHPISINYAALTTASLETTLNLSAIDPPNPPDLALSETLAFTITFSETPNIQPCGFQSETICDDIFVIELGALDNQFTYMDQTYFISIVTLDGGLTPLPATTCAAAGAPPGCLGFTTPEDAATTLGFGIMITTQPVQVPAPGALIVLGLTFVGLAFARRRV